MCICNFEYLPKFCLKFRLHSKFNNFPKIHFTGMRVLGRQDESREETYLETEKIQPNHVANKFCLVPAEKYLNGKWKSSMPAFLCIHVLFGQNAPLQIGIAKNVSVLQKKNIHLQYYIPCCSFWNFTPYFFPNQEKNISCFY